MLRSLNALVALAGISVLAACASSGSLTPTGASTVPAAIKPDKNCGGAGGVNVAPCPIRLSRHTKSGIVVTVGGPGVVNSYLGRINGCFNGRTCYTAERHGNSNTEWLITPGQSCGSADVEFDGVNASGQQVGYFFLKVSNHYCP